MVSYMMVCKYILLLSGLFALANSQAIETPKVPLTLKIEPLSAIKSETVNITCSTPLGSTASTASYEIKKDGATAGKYVVNCNTNRPFKVERNIGGEWSGNCNGVSLIISQAASTLEGNYQCVVDLMPKDGDPFLDGRSESVRLTVGERTPPIKTFQVTLVKTMAAVTDMQTLKAGANLSIECATDPVKPTPKFTVTITNRETRYNLTKSNKVSFTEVLPRTPLVEFKCSVFNGFGIEQVKNISVISEYEAREEDFTVPSKLEVSAEEVKICSVANNPPKQLVVSGIEEQFLETGYPKYVQANGVSEAVVIIATTARNFPKFLKVMCEVPCVTKVYRTIEITRPVQVTLKVEPLLVVRYNKTVKFTCSAKLSGIAAYVRYELKNGGKTAGKFYISCGNTSQVYKMTAKFGGRWSGNCDSASLLVSNADHPLGGNYVCLVETPPGGEIGFREAYSGTVVLTVRRIQGVGILKT